MNYNMVNPYKLYIHHSEETVLFDFIYYSYN